MKKLLYIGLLLMLFATGCENDDTIVDPVVVGYVQWVNESDHTISMTIARWKEIPVLKPGDNYMEMGAGAIGAGFSIDAVIRTGCRIVFDNGPYGGEFSFEEYGVEALNPGVPRNYVVTRYDKKPLFTYTFTNADYEAAVARGPLEDREDDAHWGFE